MSNNLMKLMGGSTIPIPDGWRATCAANFIIESMFGASIKPDDFRENGVEVIPKKAVTDKCIYALSDNDLAYVTEEFSLKSPRSVINGDCLITSLRDLVPTGPSIGRCVKVWDAKKRVLAQGVYGFKFNGDLDETLFAYISNNDYFRRQVRAIMVGSTQIHARANEYYSLPIILPPHNQQHKIAKILSTVDNLIEKTQALIDKYQSIKQGMMHDLFTRGVDGHGQLRPSYEDALHLYKESELGWIPKEWEVCALEYKLDKIIDYRGKTPVKTESGLPLITAKNVRSGYIDEEPREYIAESSYDRWMTRGIPNVGDILFTTEAPLGNVAKVPSYKMALAQRLLTLIPAEAELTQDFLYWLLLWDGTFIRLEQRSSGSTVLGIKQSVFRKMVFPFPPVEEQKIIAHSLNGVNRRVNSEQASLRKYSISKSGLMQDLLTGQVRVSV
ncbi:MAG: restriction endonuclease subunit S [Desulfuromonadaceae bacterium]|nr:restriction endonuclease subunit S [Desulfuromonadaceae bacterium]MDD2847620.1 restriction endonuclease subunit S [Desulfuromonadaceae bacterium]MDD4131134.1 restriction endonuclease subunit S [Desulfuromonadaceae bacterium]